MRKAICLFLIISFCWACSSDSSTEKHQSKRNNIINVRDQIKEIVIENVLLNNYSRVQIIENYLFIKDHKSTDELIHIFDKDNFKHITSTGLKGEGPGEIGRIAYIAEDKVNRKFYVTDEAKYKIFSYDLDSVIADLAYYFPVEKMKIGEQPFPWDYIYVNDTLCIGVTVEPIGNYDFRPVVGKFNMITGEVKHMSYTHPNIKKKRILFGISMEHGIYVECHVPQDLMTICSLDGDLKYNIHGPNWDTETHAIDHYGPVAICNNKIVALYSGNISFIDGRSNWPTKFLVFDLKGNYQKTLETEYKIINFCYDKDNHRIIMSLDDEMQFGYLDMNGLLN